MRTRVQKWGNCLAVRIPKPFAERGRPTGFAKTGAEIVGKLAVLLEG